jgi:hypothetical protein
LCRSSATRLGELHSLPGGGSAAALAERSAVLAVQFDEGIDERVPGREVAGELQLELAADAGRRGEREIRPRQPPRKRGSHAVHHVAFSRESACSGHRLCDLLA